MGRINAKERVVNNGEVEALSSARNMTIVGEVGLFRKLVKKLGIGVPFGKSYRYLLLQY